MSSIDLARSVNGLGRLTDAGCARVPARALACLGALRAHEELRGLPDGDSLWLFWPGGEVELARAILAVAGAELFLRRDGTWRRPGEHLPVFHVPDPLPAKPLSALLFPAPVAPVPPGAPAWRPASLTLVRDAAPRIASALLTARAELARWADAATSWQFQGLQAAYSGEEVLIRGDRLPAATGKRFWGKQVLLPLGFRLDPELAEGVVLAALCLPRGDVALWTSEGVETVPAEAFAPITRAGVLLLTRPEGSA